MTVTSPNGLAHQRPPSPPRPPAASPADDGPRETSTPIPAGPPGGAAPGAVREVPAELRQAISTELAPRLRGPALLPGDPGYATESLGHNRLVEHHPAVIVPATGAADVMAAVAFATEHDLPVAVHSTGHTATQPADGAVMISTRGMTGVRIDPMTRTARIEAGVRWEQVVHEAAAFGLAPLSGSAPNVGVVGYTLGGGLPLLGRTFGYAADHVRSLDVVTGHGALRQVSPQMFDDLFWALRGGKGNFGVVTSLEMDLVPVPRLYGGNLVFPGSAAREVLNAYRRWARRAPEELTSSVALLRFPLEMAGPAELRGRFVVDVRVAYHGSAADGAELVQPLRRIGVPLLDTVRDMPYSETGTIHNDPVEPFPLRERTVCLTDLDEDAVDALVDAAGPDTTCPLQLVELRQLGGALSRDPEVPNCVGNRDAGFSLYTATVDGPGAEAYADLVIERMRPWHTGGKLLNFLGPDDPVTDSTGSAYAPADLARLAQVKRAYDPQNTFRFNHNIEPSVPRRLWS